MNGVLYRVGVGEANAFGKQWCGPKEFKHAEPTLIAQYTEIEGDGRPAEIWCTAMPSRFYEVRVTYDTQLVCLSTGSGWPMAGLARQIANAIVGGMLSINTSENFKGYSRKTLTNTEFSR